MDTFVFLGAVGIFDLFVAVLIWRDMLTMGIDRQPLTERLTNAALPLSFGAAVVGVIHLWGAI